LPNPPFHRRMEGFHAGRVRAVQQAENIEVRVLGMKLFGGRGAVQDHGFQIIGCGALQFLHKLIEFMICQF
jgi:hypothetical protein